MSSSKLVKRVYRSLLRLTQRFDRQPAAKMLIYRKHISKRKDNHSAASFYYNGILDTMLRSSNFYQPHVGDFSLTDFVKTEFRARDTIVGHISFNDRIDVSLLFMKKLSATWKVYVNGTNEFQKHGAANGVTISGKKNNGGSATVKAQTSSHQPDHHHAKKKTPDAAQRYLGKINASLTLNLTPGSLLVAHPLVSGPLHRSVVLLLEHSVDNGSYGLVINRTTDHTISSAVKNLPVELVQVFGGNRVHFGGMVRRLQYIHDVPDCGGIPIPMCEKRSLFAGGQIGKVVSSVQGESSNAGKNAVGTESVNGELVSSTSEKHETNVSEKAKSVQFFVGCCAWDTRVLEEELSLGYWIPIIAKPDMLLDYAAAFDTTNATVGSIDDDKESGKDDRLPSSTLSPTTTTTTTTTTSATATTHRHGRQDVGNMWSNVIASLGPQFDVSSIAPHIAVTNVDPIDF